jgi:hypothetical protein
MPFAVGVLMFGVWSLKHFNPVNALAMAVLLVLSLLAKPNYALVFIPCYALAVSTLKIPTADKFLGLAAALVIPIMVLWGQAVVLAGPKGTPGEGMIISPFESWDRFSSNIAVSAFVGVVFPLAVLLLYRGRFESELALKISWGALALAIVQNAVLAESGVRATAGNWGWAMIFASHILFLVSCEFLLRQQMSWRKITCFLVFFLHVACGALYLDRTWRNPLWSVFY